MKKVIRSIMENRTEKIYYYPEPGKSIEKVWRSKPVIFLNFKFMKKYKYLGGQNIENVLLS